MDTFYIKGRIDGDIFKMKRVVLFPAGKNTETLLRFNRPANVFCVCDNSESRQGGDIDGIPIVAPDALARETEGFCAVVTSVNLAAGFYNQLKEIGVADRCEFAVCVGNFIPAKKFLDPFTFIDKRRRHDKALIVLAGYKDKLCGITLRRIKRFIPGNIDVCVVSSGKYVEKLNTLCAENGWSYLSTTVNNISVTQNIAIELHPDAEFIYKLDEDIFICAGFFEGLMKAFKEAEAGSRYHVGMVTPIIPVNPHGMPRFLEKTGRLAEFEAKFGKAYYDYHSHFGTRSEETLFLWEISLPLDETAGKFRNMPFSYRVCPHRLSIGAILYRRSVWAEMKGFTVTEGTDLGSDEVDFARFFLTGTGFYTYIMAENVLAGHYSFGRLDDPAKLDGFYENNKSLFDIREDDRVAGV